MGLSTDSNVEAMYQKQLDALQKQLDKTSVERDEYRDALATTADEHEKIKASVGKDTDALSKLTAERDGLVKEKRDRVHFDKFAELAKGAGAKQAAVKHLWELSHYVPEDDEPNEKALTKALDAMKKSADFNYAFDAAGTETTTTTETDRGDNRVIPSRAKYPGLHIREDTPEPAAAGRGGRSAGQDGTLITPEMRGDPAFMLDPKNQKMIQAAAADGRFR